MANREDGKSVFEDALDARDDAERGGSASLEAKPLMIVSAILAAVSACFVDEPVLRAGLIVSGLICSGMTITLRWDRPTWAAELERAGRQG